MPAASPNVKALLAANWKMNPVDGGEAVDLVKGVVGIAGEAVDNVEVALFPPFPWLLGVAEVLEGSGVKLGAQDCFWEVSGACDVARLVPVGDRRAFRAPSHPGRDG